jgi:ABC-type molybdate transport system ATPase subunit
MYIVSDKTTAAVGYLSRSGKKVVLKIISTNIQNKNTYIKLANHVRVYPKQRRTVSPSKGHITHSAVAGGEMAVRGWGREVNHSPSAPSR